MKIQLPLETWMAILDWILRRELAEKLESKKLWDSQLTPIIQYSLHEWRKNVKLAALEFCERQRGKVFTWRSCEGRIITLPIPQVEIPRNITSLKHITISYLDSDLLGLLCKMRLLLQNVRLHIDSQQNSEITLRHCLPVLGNFIEAISISSPEVLPIILKNHEAVLFNTKLLHMEIYPLRDMEMETEIKHILAKWLFTRHDDGQARVLVVSINHVFYQSFFTEIQKRFVDKTRRCACPFFIRIFFWSTDEVQIESSILENGQTGEKLIIRKFSDFLITNCAQDVDRVWLAKKEREILQSRWTREQEIWLRHTELGQF